MSITTYPDTPTFQKLRFWLSFVAGLLGFGEVFLLGGYAFGGNATVQLVGFTLGLGMGLSWLIWRGIIWRGHLPRTGLEWGIGLGVVVVAVSLALSPDPRQGLWRAGWLAGFALLFYIFLDILDTGSLDRWGVLGGLAAAVGLVLLQATAETWQWYRSWFEAAGGLEFPPTQYRFFGILIASPTMGLANLLVFAVILAAWRVRWLLVRLGAMLWLVFYGLALPFSSSRSAWVALVAGLVVGGALWAWETRPWRRLRGWSRKKLIWSGLGLVLGALALGLLAVGFIIVFASSPSHAGDPFGTSGRERFIAASLEMWKGAPWFGVGPGRYAFDYLRVDGGILPSFWPYQAHNIIFQVLAEFGGVGLAAGLLLLGLLVRWGWRLYRLAQPELRAWVGALLAGLAALLVQLLFDDVTQWVAVCVPVVFVLAWAGGVLPGGLMRFPRISLVWLVLPMTLLLSLAGWSYWANQPYTRWLEFAQSGDWRKAAEQASESAWRDPSFHFYQTEAGLLWAWEWAYANDPNGLENARFHLEWALALEPAASWTWANLAVLDAAAGDLPLATRRMQKATELAPNMAVFALNLGKFYELAGRYDLARASYFRTLELNPGWIDLSFWKVTPIRGEILFQSKQKPILILDTNTYWWKARLAIAAGRLDEAARYLKKSRLMNESEIEIVRSTLRLAEARGDDAAAEQARARLAQLPQVNQQQVDAGVAFFYPDFVSHQTGIGITAVPGLMP